MKKLFVIFFVLISASVSVLYYYWRQATKLPDWYPAQSSITPTTQEFSNSSEVRDAEARLQAKIAESIAKSPNEHEESLPSDNKNTNFSTNASTQDNYNVREQQLVNKKNVEIELSNQEASELVTSTIVKQINHHKELSNVPRFHTTIKEGIIESGTVINISELPKHQLPESETALLEKVRKNFPFLENQKVYIGIAGQPKIENGQLKLDDNPKIKLGDLSLSLSELSQRLNIPQEQLEQKLNKSLQLGRLKVNDLELTDNKVLLKGTVDK